MYCLNWSQVKHEFFKRGRNKDRANILHFSIKAMNVKQITILHIPRNSECCSIHSHSSPNKRTLVYLTATWAVGGIDRMHWTTSGTTSLSSLHIMNIIKLYTALQIFFYKFSVLFSFAIGPKDVGFLNASCCAMLLH